MFILFDMQNINIGIVGMGYVGKACYNFFKKNYPIFTFDINNSGSEDSLEMLISKSEITFICVPTPMTSNGACDTSIVEETLKKINDYGIKQECVIKSTIPPGSTSSFANKFRNIDISFNPEFLTEANFLNDFINQDRIIIGTNQDCDKVINIYKDSFPNAQIIQCKPEEAEMVKYFTNSFLATKVAFANEFYQLCKEADINYNNVARIALKDKRLGKSHFSVPGPDNKLGFGGSCLPKDINGIINVFKKYNINPYVLNSVWKRNIEKDRPEQDWRKLVGRAVNE